MPQPPFLRHQLGHETAHSRCSLQSRPFLGALVDYKVVNFHRRLQSSFPSPFVFGILGARVLTDTLCLVGLSTAQR